MSRAISKLFGKRAPSDSSLKPGEREPISPYAGDIISAAQRGEAETVARLLVSRKAKISDRDSHGATALHWAARNGSVPVCRILLQQPGADVDVLDDTFSATPLSWAVASLREHPRGCCAVISFLLSKDADRSIRNYKGYTPLRLLLRDGPNSQEFTDALTSLVGLDIDCKDSAGLTPLMIAAAEQRPESVQTLLSFSASVDVIDNHGATPLHHAIAIGKPNSECIYLLLKHGANINAADHQAETPFDMALSHAETIFTAVRTSFQQSPGSESKLLALRGYEAQVAFHILRQEYDTMTHVDSHTLIRRLLVKLAKEADCTPEYLLLTIKPSDYFGEEIPGSYGFVQGALYKTPSQILKVAVKKCIITDTALNGMQGKISFIREALIWRHVKHEYVLPLIGVQYTPEVPNMFRLVSPWMKNGSLHSYSNFHKGKIPHNKWLLQVVQGLHYLHTENVMHGDLRADNVMIDDNLQIKLIDFGLAVFAESTTVTLGPHPNPGHPRWISPELLKGKIGRSDAYCDVFSYGRLCVEVYTGLKPFAEKYPSHSQDAIISKEIIAQNIQPERPSKMSNTLWNLTQECWKINPLERPDTKRIIQILQNVI